MSGSADKQSFKHPKIADIEYSLIYNILDECTKCIKKESLESQR